MPRARVESSIEEAVRGAHIVCTVTGATEPVLAGDLLEPGMHVNAVGACRASHRELDDCAIHRSCVIVDSRDATSRECGELVDQPHAIAGELGDVLLGKISGRTHDDDITLFKSVGLGVQDVAVAEHLYQNALGGDHFDFGGYRRDPDAS